MAQRPSPPDLEARIADLEVRLTFQEDQTDALQRALYEQVQSNNRLEAELRRIQATLRLGVGGEDAADEPPPPHY
ncbi:MAG: SlyX family protein [Planctomycetota bacterium]